MDKSVKAARLADQTRDYLALWTRRDLEGHLFSITQVTVSLDLRQATAWVEVMDQTKQETIMKLLRRYLGTYQRDLQRARQKQFTPLLSFSLDRSQELNQHFDQLLNSP